MTAPLERPRCVLFGCMRTATRGMYAAAVCSMHGPRTPLAPGVTEDDDRAAVAFDDSFDATFVTADQERKGPHGR